MVRAPDESKLAEYKEVRDLDCSEQLGSNP
jgi:hypothetical protein